VVGWLDSRVGNDEIGVAACEGVVPAEAGVDASYMRMVSTSAAMPAACQPGVFFDVPLGN